MSQRGFFYDELVAGVRFHVIEHEPLMAVGPDIARVGGFEAHREFHREVHQ